MFERFTHAAREAVVQAQNEAREMRQSPIGTEHVLLALLADPVGPVAQALRANPADRPVDAAFVRAEIIRRVHPGPTDPKARADTEAEDAAALKAIGIDLDAVRKAIEENFGPGALDLPPEPAPKSRNPLRRRAGGSPHLPFSSRAKKVLELSLREAVNLRHNYIAPEHLMLGILREGDGLAALILAEANVDLAKLRADLVRALPDKAA
jgi:ATP-dependent Clp protease ATP-binding subunit ClpA